MKIKEKVTDNEGHVSQMDSMDVTSFPWLCEPICSILQASKRNPVLISFSKRTFKT
jgi:hypothetical protein